MDNKAQLLGIVKSFINGDKDGASSSLHSYFSDKMGEMTAPKQQEQVHYNQEIDFDELEAKVLARLALED